MTSLGTSHPGVSSSDTSSEERDPLLSPTRTVYYDSFSSESVSETPSLSDGNGLRYLTSRDCSRGPTDNGVGIFRRYSAFAKIYDVLCKARSSMTRGVHHVRLFLCKNLHQNVSNAIVICLMGIAAAFVAYIVDVSETRLFDWKYGFCKRKWTASKLVCCAGYTTCDAWETWSVVTGVSKHELSAFNYLLHLTLVVVLAGLSFLFTTFTRIEKTKTIASGSQLAVGKLVLPPHFAAAGSGVLEVKQAIMGISSNDAWKPATLILKSLGLILSTSSGLNVGKEGPYIHLAAIAAVLINSRLTPMLRIQPRKALMVGSAAGLAVAFGAPLSGSVFVIEGLCQNLSSTNLTQLIGGNIVAVFFLTALNPYGRNKTTPFEIRYSTSWTSSDLFIFIAIGIAGGLAGALFTGSVRLWSSSYRQLGVVKRHPAVDVLFVAIITALTSFSNKYLRLSTGELISQLTTSYGQTSEVPRGDSRMDEMADTIGLLGIGLLSKFFLTVITFGIQVPQGIYMPSMAIGAILGRCIGQSAHMMRHNLRDMTFLGGDFGLQPAVCTMAGAGAVMAGVTRLNFTIIVIVFELSHSWDYAVPFALTIFIAKALAAYLEPQGIYDLAADLHEIPESLDTSPSASHSTLEVCLERQRSRSLSINLVPEYLTQAGILKAIVKESEAEAMTALPILVSLKFVGCVSTWDLHEALGSLDDHTQVIITRGADCALEISTVHEIRQPQTFEMAEQHYPTTHKLLGITPIPTFDLNNTVLSINEFFKASDIEYVVLTQRGVFCSMLTRKMLADWC